MIHLSKYMSLTTLASCAIASQVYSQSLHELSTMKQANETRTISRVRIEKEILVKNGEDDVWFQAGKTTYNYDSLHFNSPYCEIDTDEEELVNKKNPHYEIIEHGVLIKSGNYEVIKEAENELEKNPMRHSVKLSFIRSDKKESGNFIDYLKCTIPADMMRDLQIHDITQITGGSFLIENLELE